MKLEYSRQIFEKYFVRWEPSCSMPTHAQTNRHDKAINPIFIDPCIADESEGIPKRCSFVLEFIIPKFIEGSTCFEISFSHSTLTTADHHMGGHQML